MTVHADGSSEPTRRAVTLVDDARERTIMTLGARLQPGEEVSEAAWAALGEVDGVYFTAGDVGALRAARAAARVLVASPRAGAALEAGGPPRRARLQRRGSDRVASRPDVPRRR